MTEYATDAGFQRFLRQVGKRIEHLRTERRWTADQLARNSGLPPSNVAQIEAGELDFTLDTITRFANVFEVKIADLFQGVD